MPKKCDFSVFACILVILSLMFGDGNYNTGSMAYADERVTPTHVPTPTEQASAKPSPTGPLPVEGQPWSSSGWLNIVWGDGPEGASETVYTLTDDSGQIIPLFLDEMLSQSVGGVLWFDRKKVNVEGVWATFLSVKGAATVLLNVTSISLAPSPETGALGGDVSPAVIGSQPWVTIMCKFSDVATEPHNLAYFTGMYANVKPGLDHYWREQSYDTFNVAGSNAFGWFVLPQPEAHYEHTNPAGLHHLADDCIAAADASVNFAPYVGINMMFNFDWYNGWAWGGSYYKTIDGVTKSWRMTWEPPWAYADISVIQHEMGHGFGLPHSSGAYGQTYDNAWDVMSWDRYNCSAATDPTYGCIGQGTISYQKDILGVIPAGQKSTVTLGSSTTITLEQLDLPATSNYRMAQIPIGGSSTHFYSVEARRLTGYDSKLPGAAVIIHEVDTTRLIPAHVIDTDLNGNTADAGAMWIVGDRFVDATNNISVDVDLATATGFQVTITVNPPPDTTPPPAPIGLTASPSTWTNYNLFTIDWTNPSDPSGIAGAYFKLSSPPTYDTDGIYYTNKPFYVGATAEGGQPIYVWLKDGAGNTSYLNWSSTTLYYDVTAPTITITNPTSDPIYSTSSSTLSMGGSASDNIGVTQVTWSNDRGGSGTCSGTTSWSASGITLYSGQNNILVTARDAANNTGIDTLTVTYTAPAGTLQFSSATYSVNENGGSVLITVTRTGGSNGVVGVSYATSNGTATAGSDYTATSGALSWANGDTSSKSFSVSIIDDAIYEANETVNLTLSNPTGGAALGSPGTAVLTVIENDSAAPTITIVSPSGGETWSAGMTQTVRWSYTGNPRARVKIELLKGGVFNRKITSFASIGSGGNGLYNWKIPSKQSSGSDYQIRVTSTKSGSCTDTSDGSFVIVGLPPAPTNVSASDRIYADRVEVTWTASPWATSYTVYRSTSSGNLARKTALGTTQNLSFDDTTAVPNKTYFYWVKATNANGTSGFSAPDAGYR
jgi:M6 family metalloprotease-like protein